MTDDVSRVVALAWGAEAAPQRGPRRGLSLERIVDAAIDIADAEGLQAVSMQRVAQTFGYTTMAMYRYVANKDDLHHLMLDAAGRGAFAVDDENWRTGLEQVCLHLLDIYRRHPWVLDIPISFEAMLMPEQVRIADAALRAMRTLDTGREERLLLLMHLSTFVRGHASLMRQITRPDGRVTEGTRALVRQAVSTGRYPDLAPLVQSGVYLGASESPEESGDEWEQELAHGLLLWFAGVTAVYENEEAREEAPAAPDPETPDQALEAAERELAAVTELRKATQRRVRELEKREAAARKQRDVAKEAAKAAARLQR